MLTCNGTTCRVDGDITVSSAASIIATLKTHIAADLHTLDFSGVAQVDSSALALIIGCQREAAQYQRRLQVTGLPDSLRKLADLYGVTSFIQA